MNKIAKLTKSQINALRIIKNKEVFCYIENNRHGLFQWTDGISHTIGEKLIYKNLVCFEPKTKCSKTKFKVVLTSLGYAMLEAIDCVITNSKYILTENNLVWNEVVKEYNLRVV